MRSAAGAQRHVSISVSFTICARQPVWCCTLAGDSMRSTTFGDRLPIGVLLVASACALSIGAHAEEQGQGGELTLHVGALAELIDEVGGRGVALPRARVIAVLS